MKLPLMAIISTVVIDPRGEAVFGAPRIVQVDAVANEQTVLRDLVQQLGLPATEANGKPWKYRLVLQGAKTLMPGVVLKIEAVDRVPRLGGGFEPGVAYELPDDEELRADQNRRTRIPLLDRVWRWLHGEPKLHEKDQVNCAVFSPPTICPGSTILIQVFAHLPTHNSEAMSIAQEFDDETRRLGLSVLHAEIEAGEVLTFRLALESATVEEPTVSLTWKGRTTTAAFRARIAASPNDTLFGKLVISKGREQIPIGRIIFKLSVRTLTSHDWRTKTDPSEPTGSAKRFRLAFISYAAEDLAEVLKRVQMLRLMNIEFFQDLMSLSPGERWERAIYKMIDRVDVFFLFWSTAASKSEWVRREIKYALVVKRGEDENPPEIVPVIIEGPPMPLPPEELKHLHFSDSIVYLLPKSKAKVDKDGDVRCPNCGRLFATYDSHRWDGVRHRTCGTELDLIPET